MFFERFVSKSRARKIEHNGEIFLDGSLLADVDNDISELNKVSSLLNKKDNTKIPGFTNPTPGPSGKKDPSLDKLSVALIEFILKKTQDPEDWTYIINYMVEKLGLEFEDDDDADRL